MVFAPLRRLYDWVLAWSQRPNARLALFALAFAESSFFPVPPDVLLIAMAVAIPARAFVFALITTAGSVLGGLGGYAIGYGLMASIGNWLLELYQLHAAFEQVRDWYLRYDFWAVFVAAFTPIPYKVFTLAAGAFEMDVWRFAAASVIGRGARFFLVAWLIHRYGEAIRDFIDRYFNWLTVLFAALLVGFSLLVAWR